jgi:imidazolonepropionase-like amidohydrolase
MFTRVFFFATLLALLTSCRTTNKHSDILFLQTGRLIDGINDMVYRDLDLIIISGRIAGVGQDLKVPANARIIDLKKYTVLPRLIDRQKIVFAGRQSHMKAIQMATSVAAKASGQENKVGSVTPGLYADLIAIEGDPLVDIRNLENVKFEIRDGSAVTHK